MNRFQLGLVLLLGVAMVVGCIGAPYPHELWLQHSATVLAIVAVLVLPRWYPLSNQAIACLIAFFLLHVLAARYIYSYVPYDDWCEALFGFRISMRMHWTRNHFDRLVHFCFGALMILPCWEVSNRHLHVGRRAAYFYALTMVATMSVLYELFEWSLTMTLGAHDIEAYNGQQGDPWDAQKDMALALLGGVLAVVVLSATRLIASGQRRSP